MRRLVAALGAAGCGGSSDSGGASSPAPGAISMKDLKFSPDSATVKVGEKVTWTNDDDVDHNVTATSGAKPKGNQGTVIGTSTEPGASARSRTIA